MSWTNEPPTEPGWYFVKAPDGNVETVFVQWNNAQNRKLIVGYQRSAIGILIALTAGLEWWPERIQEPPQ